MRLPNGLQSLKELELQNCPIDQLPTDMRSLTTLTCNECNDLSQIPQIYAVQLDKLSCFQCPNLKFPRGITSSTELSVLSFSMEELEELQEIAEAYNEPNICLKTVLKRFPTVNIDRLAPFLKRLNTEDLIDINFSEGQIYKFLKLCTNLERLDISDLDLEGIPYLKKLQILHCYWCKNLKELPALKCLASLKCYDCPNLRQLPKGLQSLKEIELNDCPIEQLPTDMQSLTSLSLSACNDLSEIPQTYVPQLFKLKDSDCERLQLPRGLSSLTELSVLSITMEELPEELNPQLKVLEVSGCSELKSIPHYLSALETLNCLGCTSLKSLPVDLSSLVKLDCSYCSDLECFPKSFPVLNELKYSKFPFSKLPNEMPSIKTIHCNDADILEKIPDAYAGQLEKLHCDRCPKLSLPKGLKSLKKLSCRHSSMRELPEGLNPQLKTLDCSNCAELEEIPDSLGALESFVSDRCASLKKRPAYLK